LSPAQHVERRERRNRIAAASTVVTLVGGAIAVIGRLTHLF
jgi:hypothetical protein